MQARYRIRGARESVAPLLKFGLAKLADVVGWVAGEQVWRFSPPLRYRSTSTVFAWTVSPPLSSRAK